MQSEVHRDLEKLSFLIGRWEGVGVAGYAELDEFQFGQEVEFSNEGGPYLGYRSRVWKLTADGSLDELWTSESGYWRCLPASAGESAEDTPPVHVEALISHPEGYSEIYLGTVFASRVELTTDAVVRTESGQQVTAGKRLYGLFGEERETLGYAWDMAARGHDLRSFMSAQLKQVD
ncbi:fatty acid-binding protein [Streptomonospora alba]|uniref:Ferric nitrobindin-like protein n=1 Tax=Streptomonospora alba TaxID=183763 RepID=A0A0C2JK95_9ACTN|nr:FABP family protein [Streptomonospora alba]KIH99370.1 fatty acid-binding protein [Streptomonospora alba]